MRASIVNFAKLVSHRNKSGSIMSRTFASESSGAQLTAASMNEHLLKAEYAVRGELVIKAGLHQGALARGEERPFQKVIFCNIGNPQELGQKPISYPREVTALVNCPDLLESDHVEKLFAPDVIERARRYLTNISGGVGAYSNSQGVPYIREEVAEFITERDGHAGRAEDIFLTDGASPAVQMLVRSMIRDEADTLLIPIPQYPLYSASIALCGGSYRGYYLDEESNWSLDVNELRRSLVDARAEGKNVRAVAVINPGNPTGNCLDEANMREVVKFCASENLVLLADEVYQENIWTSDKPFVSFKKVACDVGLVDPITGRSDLQLASFHSVSKGFYGECGRRGGYVELVGFDQGVRAQLYKLASVSLCSNLAGQLMVGLMVNPPREGEESYEKYVGERDGILTSLQARSKKLAAAFNRLEGVSCQDPEGALYAFPQITLSKAAAAAAEDAGRAPDMFYCLRLLDATGIVVVPGSGFGQRDGTFHFRSTILPAESEIDAVIDQMSTFHQEFMDEFRD